jgi:antirestriction protein
MQALDSLTVQNLPYPNDWIKDVPRVYVSCLAAYNAGIYHGAWIEATDEDEMMENINYILSQSPIPNAEEWMFNDFMEFEGANVGEYTPVEEVVRIGQAIEKHGKAYVLYHGYHGNDTTVKQFEEDYLGCYENEEDFVYQQLDDMGVIKRAEEIGLNPSYIDYSQIALDWFIESYLAFRTAYNKCHVFLRR